MYQTTHVEYIETPSLVGKNINESFVILSAHNLNPRLLGQNEEPELPEGTILRQTPYPKQKIKSHQSIFLVVSKKPPTKQAPHCVNKSVDEINHLIPKTIRIDSHQVPSTYPINRCFAQFPAPSEALDNNQLTLYISAGNNKPIIWPDFTHKEIQEVTNFLQKYQIKPHVIHYHPPKPNHVCKTCHIIEQRPLAGSLISLDNTKNISVQLRVR